MMKVLVDVDSMFGGVFHLGVPRCKLRCCERTKLPKDLGPCLCGQHSWCKNLRRSRSTVAAYRDPQYFVGRKPLVTVKPALNKLLRCGWIAALWTTRPLNQTVQITTALRESGIWEKFQLLTEGKVLHALELPLGWDYSIETAKLTILEKAFGEDLDQSQTLVAIEQDPMEDLILREYTQGRVIVHKSPKVWEAIADTNSDEMLNELLATERRPPPRGKMFYKENNPHAAFLNGPTELFDPVFRRPSGLASPSSVGRSGGLRY